MRICLLCLLLLPAAATAVEIYRCEDRYGRQVFSDQPCRAIGALPLPSERDPLPAPPPREPAQADASPDEALMPLEPPEAAAGCPGPTPQALGQALVAAAGRADQNAIAGMYHWPSAGRGATRRVFAEATRLIAAGALVFEVVPPREDDAWLWAGQPPPEVPRLLPAELLIERLDPPGVLIARYPLVAHAGCYWLPL